MGRSLFLIYVEDLRKATNAYVNLNSLRSFSAAPAKISLWTRPGQAFPLLFGLFREDGDLGNRHMI